MRTAHLLQSLLPPPNYLLMHGVGVDVSESSLKYAYVSRSRLNGSRLELKEWGERPLEPGTISGGRVEDPEKLSAHLRVVADIVGTPFVHLALPEERAYIFEMSVPVGLSPAEVQSSIEFSLTENVPLDVRETHFDYAVTPHVEDGERDLVVTAYARDVLEGYRAACEQADLTPLRFEVESQAMHRAVASQHSWETYLLVDLGRTRTGLGVVHQGVLAYTTTIDLGGAQLTRALSRYCGVTDESEVITLMNERGIDQSEVSEGVYEALIATLSAIKDEISQHLTYWHHRRRHQRERAINRVVLCGGTANIRGLPAYFERSFSLPVVRADIWHNLSHESDAAPIDARHAYGYATALGLALAPFLP